MARYQADSLFVASIYPGKLDPIRRNYGPSIAATGMKALRSTVFQFKPVPRGGKADVIEVFDSFQSVPSWVNGGNKEMIDKPVTCQEIVSDILASWTGGLFNVPEGAKPGVIMISASQPTKAESDEMKLFQTRYFEYLFNEGEMLHSKKDWSSITATMRLGAEWLGRNAVWSDPGIAAKTEPCPACGQTIPNWVSVCSHCGSRVRAMSPELAALNLQTPVLAGK